jgi:hypothetical protein
MLCLQHGWGVRIIPSVLQGCIPVIIQVPICNSTASCVTVSPAGWLPVLGENRQSRATTDHLSNMGRTACGSRMTM